VLAILADGLTAPRSYRSHVLTIPAYSFATFSGNGFLLFGTHGGKSTIGSSFLFLPLSPLFHL
jgi:hypothetical protein